MDLNDLRKAESVHYFGEVIGLFSSCPIQADATGTTLTTLGKKAQIASTFVEK